MTFVNAAFLFGLAAVAAPIILHLIHRQRYPERRFTTLRFFDITIKHNVVQRRLIDRILLLLRILMLVLLMLALARPFWAGGSGARSLAVLIVVDNSPSMARTRDGTPLFEQARAAASRLLDELKPGDQAALLLTAASYDPVFSTDRAAVERELRGRAGRPTGILVKGEQGPTLAAPGLATDLATLRQTLQKIPVGAAVALTGPGCTPEPQLTPDLRALRQQLGQARLSDRPGDLPLAIRRADKLLADSREVDRVVAVVSDLQKSDWAETAPLRLPGTKVVVLALDSEKRESPNLSIDDGLVSTRNARFGQGVVCAVKVTNRGTAKPVGSPALEIEVGGQQQVIKASLPPVAPGASVLVPFVVPAAVHGRTLFCSARLVNPTDPFPYDDSWFFQVPFSPPFRVLCVNAAGSAATPAAKSGYFVMNALAPRNAGTVTEVFADVEECGAEELKGRELFQYNTIVLAGVERLDKESRELLRAFAEDGGGLLVFPGAKTTAEEYNGWGFLPAQITETKKDSVVFVDSVSEEEPFMADLAARLAGAARGLGAENWLRLEPPDGSTVLARLSNGAPALVATTRGKGRVILAAAGAHVDAASSWPLRPAFVILVRGLVAHLASAGLAPVIGGQRGTDEGLATTIPHEMLGGAPGAFAVGLSAGSFRYASLPWLRQDARLLLPPQERPGHYTLSVQPAAVTGVLAQPGLGASLTPMAVNHSTRESVLAFLSAKEIKERCQPARLDVVSAGAGRMPALDELSSGRELWRVLALAALAFIAVETLVAWRSVSGAGT